MTKEEAIFAAQMHKAGVALSLIADVMCYDRKTIYNGWKRYGIDGQNRRTCNVSQKDNCITFGYMESRVRLESEKKRKDGKTLLYARYEEFKKGIQRDATGTARNS